LYPGICLTIEEKARKNLRVVEKCPDMQVKSIKEITDDIRLSSI
jgi:hypothetical protein